VNTPTRLGLYGVALAVAFTGALGLGRLVGPEPAPPAEAHGHTPEATAAEPPGGLQVSEAGYRLVPETTALTPGVETQFRFRVLGPDGAAVTRYTPEHDRDLHLIVVRRDLSDFQHVHPTRDADGLWHLPLTVADAGQYRVLADFRPAARETGLTLGVDVAAPGTYAPRALPAPSPTASVEAYSVELAGALVPGTSSRLTLTVRRDGSPVTDLQPYLGAFGHLVALRDGDLAYLHVHPEEGNTLTFYAEVPSAGTYRLYLDFKHGDVVRTAGFTVVTA
jgi:hypothetical protein